MVIAVDIGGTKTSVATFDDSGAIANKERFATVKDSQAFLNELYRRLDRIAPQPNDTIVVASAGLIDTKQKMIIYSPNLGWNNMPLGDQLSRRYNCTVYLENDATIGALGAALSLPMTPPLVLYVTIGTGIGGGLIMDGRIHESLNRIEVGHMIFRDNAGLDTWENMASGTALDKLFGKEVSEITDPQAWNIVAERLSIGLRALIPALQPDIILLGGGVAAKFDAFGALLNAKVREQVPDFIPVPLIQQATNPEQIVLNGCYYYARQHSKPESTS